MSHIWNRLVDMANNVFGILGVANGGTGIASGTSGGVPYYSASGTIASSGALTASRIVLGGGAGATPASLSFGTGNQVLGMNSAATAYEHKTMAVGTTGSDFAVANAANSVTFNLPDAGASARGAVTTGTQTFAGAKTFSTQLIGKGTATNDTASAGFIGEYMEIIVTSAASFGTANQYADFNGSGQKLPLTAGDWDIDLQVVASFGSSSTFTAYSIALATTTGNAGGTVGTSEVATFPPTASSQSLSKLTLRVSLAGSQDYYGKVYWNGTGTVPTYRGQLRARRMR